MSARAPVPAPPRHLRGDARRAWRALAPKLVALGLYLPIDRRALEGLCGAWSWHVAASRALANAPRRRRPALEDVRDSFRLQARQLAAAFLVLPKARVHLGALGPDGEDLELARLFTPGVRLRRVRLTPDEELNLAAWTERYERSKS
jgi:phage terminase small subunit